MTLWNRTSVIVVIFAVLFGALMLSYPQIDLIISGYFYDPETQSFPLSQDILFVTIHNATRWLVIASILFYGFLWWRAYRGKPLLGITRKQAVFLLLVLGIAPGLVANTLLKDNWGRARPSQITEFGGEKQFSPPLLIAYQCERNCSFVSGDPSVGFHFFGFMMLLFARTRKIILLPFTLGAILGITRIVMGAHFFSDVIFSGIFMYLVAYILFVGLRRLERRDTLRENL
jgi:lipid A 4'-phosphatase